jgi:hypothetical protein
MLRALHLVPSWGELLDEPMGFLMAYTTDEPSESSVFSMAEPMVWLLKAFSSDEKMVYLSILW